MGQQVTQKSIGTVTVDAGSSSIGPWLVDTSPSYDVQVWVRNTGADSVTLQPVGYSIGGIGPVNVGTTTKTVAAGAKDYFEFTANTAPAQIGFTTTSTAGTTVVVEINARG